MERLAAEHSLDLERSYAYGNSFADRWMLARVGHPCVVQVAESSSSRLAWLARRRGWPVLRWGAANRKEGEIQRKATDRAKNRSEIAAVTGAEMKSR